MKNYVKAIVTFIFLMAAVAFVPTKSEAALSAPTNLQQTDASDGSVKFSWAAVPNAEDYYYSWSDGVNWSEPTKVYSFSNEYTIYSLTAGSTYYVRVYAADAKDNLGAPSQTLEVVTAPSISNVTTTVTGVTNNAISFSWTPAAGATSYDITSRYDNIVPNMSVTGTSATLGNLAASTWYGLGVVPCRTASTGYKAVGSTVSVTYTQTLAGVPATPSTSSFGISSGSASAGNVTFLVSNPGITYNGYELQVCTLKGKVVKTITSTVAYSNSVKFSKNTPYKYRVRLFVTNGTSKLYSGWSGYRYFWLQNVTGKKHYSFRSKYAKIKLNWKKMSAAKGYTISMSTSRDGKYKKVKTLGKKAKSVTLTKYGKKRLDKYKTYYIKVTAKVKDGKKTLKNDAQLVNYNY